MGESAAFAPLLRAEAGPSELSLRRTVAPKDSCDFRGIVGRAVIDDDEFVIESSRVSESSEAALEVATPVLDGDHH